MLWLDLGNKSTRLGLENHHVFGFKYLFLLLQTQLDNFPLVLLKKVFVLFCFVFGATNMAANRPAGHL